MATLVADLSVHALSDVLAVRLELAKFNSSEFRQVVDHVRACFWKVNTLACQLEQCRQAVETWSYEEARLKESRIDIRIDNPLFVAEGNALNDFPLFVDMLAVYLRIQADTYATLVPWLYRRGGVIPKHSFREQRNWFINTRASFDPVYRDILASHSEWFNLLSNNATEAKGLRELIVHSYSRQHTSTSARTDGRLHLSISVDSENRGSVVDAWTVLRNTAHGWFSFLDASYIHFRGELAGLSPSFSDLHGPRPMATFEPADYQSLWIYPAIPDYPLRTA